MNFRRVTSLFLVAIMLVSVFAAAPAAAITAPTVTATDDGTGATTDHTVSFDYDNTDSPALQEIVLDYEAGDASGVTAEDVTVTIATAEETVDTVEVEDETVVTVTLETAVTLGDADTIEVTLDDVENPQNAGNYDVAVELYDDGGTSFDSDPGTDALSITVGDTPSLTSTSGMADGESIAEFDPEADTVGTETIEFESHTDNIEVRFVDNDTGDTVYNTVELDTSLDEHTIVTDNTGTDGTPSTYEMEIGHDEMSDIERQAGESGAGFDVEVHNLDADTPANDFSMTLDNSMTQSVVYMDQNHTAVDHDEREPAAWQIFTDDVTDHYVVDDTHDLDGDNTTVYMHLEDDMADEWSDVVGENAEAQDTLFTIGALENGDLYWVFYDEANADIVDEDNDSYFVFDSSNNVLEFHTGADDHGDAESADILAANHGPGDFADVGFTDLTDQFGILNVVLSGLLAISFSGLLAGGLVVAVRREN